MTSDKNPKPPVTKTVANVLAKDQANGRLVELMRAQQNALNARAMNNSGSAGTVQQNGSGSTNSQGTVSGTTKPRG
jgi:hypothetical protein